MGGQALRRHEKYIKPNTIFALFRMSAQIPLQGPLYTATLPPGNRFDRGAAVRACLHLDGNELATSYRENINLADTRPIVDFKDRISLEP